MHRDWLSDGAESNNTGLDLDGWVLLAMGCGCDIWSKWLLRWDGDKLVIALMPVVHCMIRDQEENCSLEHTNSFPDGAIPITESKHGYHWNLLSSFVSLVGDGMRMGFGTGYGYDSEDGRKYSTSDASQFALFVFAIPVYDDAIHGVRQGAPVDDASSVGRRVGVLGIGQYPRTVEKTRREYLIARVQTCVRIQTNHGPTNNKINIRMSYPYGMSLQGTVDAVKKPSLEAVFFSSLFPLIPEARSHSNKGFPLPHPAPRLLPPVLPPLSAFGITHTSTRPPNKSAIAVFDPSFRNNSHPAAAQLRSCPSKPHPLNRQFPPSNNYLIGIFDVDIDVEMHMYPWASTSHTSKMNILRDGLTSRYRWRGTFASQLRYILRSTINDLRNAMVSSSVFSPNILFWSSYGFARRSIERKVPGWVWVPLS
ncbi:hypothetical protein P692DRAFT_20862090 [Suillus brevipes Sb2]|nr:hypothetical protein P692DRAFT_20862090 [Suillus brevipes Sb2]